MNTMLNDDAMLDICWETNSARQEKRTSNVTTNCLWYEIFSIFMKAQLKLIHKSNSTSTTEKNKSQKQNKNKIKNKNKTKQNKKTRQNKTNKNKTKQNKTKQNKTK